MRTTEEASRRLEWPLEVALCGLAEDVELDHLGLVEALETEDALHEERLGELEVEVHDGDDGNAGVGALDLREDIHVRRRSADSAARATYRLGGLGEVVVADSSCD